MGHIKTLNMKKTLTIFSIVLAVTACKQTYVEETTLAKQIQNVRIVKAEKLQEPIGISASGKVKNEESATLSFKTGGIISLIAIEKGQQVKKGQVLASLNMVEINALVKQAEIQVSKLKADIDKYESLLKDSAITQQTVDDLNTALLVADEELRIAQFNQEHSTILAPYAGVVLQKMAEAGELINPGSPIVQIGNTGSSKSMLLVVSLSDRDVVKLKEGDKAEVAFDAYPSTPAKAFVHQIGAQAHPRTGVFEVELKLKDFPFPLKSGFFGKAYIYPSTKQNLLKLPMQALVEGDEKEVKVYTHEKRKVKELRATPVDIEEDFFTIEMMEDSPLYVITEGAAYVREGQEVNILQ